MEAGTPINKRDRNTFMWFGSTDDEGGYLSRYSFHDSIRDGATLPLHFEPRLSELHIDQEAIDTAFEELAAEERLTEAEKITLSKKAASIEVLIKTPSRIAKIAADIADFHDRRSGGKGGLGLLHDPQDAARGRSGDGNVIAARTQGRRQTLIVKADQLGLGIRHFGLSHGNRRLGRIAIRLCHPGRSFAARTYASWRSG